jgi:hypothetical protein
MGSGCSLSEICFLLPIASPPIWNGVSGSISMTTSSTR